VTAASRRASASLSLLAGGASGALAYGLVRAFVYLRGGGGALALVLRQQTIAYHQVLGVAAFVGLATALGAYALLVRAPSRAAALERGLARALVPSFLAAGVLDVLCP
jgi:hypothetical protein